MAFRLLKISDDQLIVLPGNYDGSGAARAAITEPGEYLLINSFKIQADGNNSITENNFGSKAIAKTAPETGMESSSAAGIKEVQQGNDGKVSSSAKKESSAKKKSSSAKKSSAKK